MVAANNEFLQKYRLSCYVLFVGARASKAVSLQTLHGLTRQICKKYGDPFKEIHGMLKQSKNRITYPDEELDLEILLIRPDSLDIAQYLKCARASFVLSNSRIMTEIKLVLFGYAFSIV